MTTIDHIKQQIEQLTFQQRCELMQWMRAGDPEDDWDRQMRADAEAGKLDHFDEDIARARKAGELRDLEELL